MKQWFASRIGLLAAVGALAFVLGCSPGAQPAQPAAGPGAETPKAETPKYGGVLELTQTATPADTDVNMYSCCPAYWPLASNRLIDSNPYNLELKPALLEKWTLASDGLSYEFKVRQGVKYQNVPPVNGREMTAEDIAFNLRRAAGMENPKNLSITNWPRASILGAMKDAVATDKSTVKVTLKQPDAGFIVGVADFRNMVFAPEVVKQYGDLRNTEKATIGVGPFILTKWQSGVVTEFKKNPDYWQKDEQGNALPYLDGVRYTIIPDKNTTMAALRTKQIDLWVGGVPQNHEDLKKTNPELQWHMSLGGC